VATQPTRPCDFCDTPIPLSDFEVGRAATLLKKNYCSSCMTAAIERSKREDFGFRSS